MADEFLYNQASNTPAKYRFSLLNPESNELRRIVTPPIEWESGQIEVKRDINVGGIFNSFVIDSLTFTKEGASFLREIWDEKEINGRCYLIVEYFKNTTKSYVEMPSRFSLNFSTAKPFVKVGNTSIGFEIEATKDDLLVKLENRRNKDIDLAKTYIRGGSEYIRSVGGAELLISQNSKSIIKMPAITTIYATSWKGYYVNSGRINNNKDYHIYTQFDMKYSFNELINTKELSYKTDVRNLSQIEYFLQNSSEEFDMRFSWIMEIEVTNRKGGVLNPQNTYAIFIEIVDKNNAVTFNERIADLGKNKGTFKLADIRTLNIKIGDNVRVYIRTDDTSGIDAYIRSSSFYASRTLVTLPERTFESLRLYSIIERALQLNLDVQFPFYSEFFGATDLVWNKNGDTYVTEDQRRFASVMSGLNLRGALLADDNNPMPSKFDDIFNSINAIWNVGYQVETIDGTQRIRIENYDWFFENVLALDLSDRISKYDIETEVMPELAYAQIKAGFKDYTYERINGRGEFNTETSYTSIINTDTTYNIVSELRADTMGITAKMAEQLTTEDTEEDNELFIIKTQRDGLNWKPEKDENILIDDNTSLFADDTFNLYFSPSRMLRRHGNRLKGAFLKFLQSYFSFQVSSKDQTLQTTGEGYTSVENQDILVNDLDAPIFKPIKHVVSCKFTFDDFETFMNNPKGYIKFSDTISGYLLSLKKSNNVDEAIIEIIEKV